ncbi:hypothetical protein ABG299_001076 [Salmonella enterica subsp. enterica]
MNEIKPQDGSVDAQEQTFEQATQPLIRWMAENVHPHHIVIVTNTSAELLEGLRRVSDVRYLRD